MKSVFVICLLFISSLLITKESLAWGRRGHAIVCENAAYLVSGTNEKQRYLKSHSFDLGYYCNAPDIIWKRPATYDLEKYNHYHDIEIFERHMPATDFKNIKSFELNRKEFNTKYSKVPDKAGRAWWRTKELFAQSEDIKKLWSSEKDLNKKKDHQLKWLSTVGIMGHYVGDLSVPLHVTENYDGQLTGNKGIHSFFEEILVDHLYQAVGLQNKAFKLAQKKWPRFSKEVQGLTLTQLLHRQSEESLKVLAQVLKIDTKIGRAPIQKAANSQQNLIIEQLAHGSLYYAEFLRRQANFEFDDNRFFSFDEHPKYIDANK